MTRFADQLDVENVVNLGYAFHLAHDVEGNVSKDGKVALSLLKDLAELRAEAGTPDASYLSSVRGATVALGEALNEIERQKVAAYAEADDYRMRQRMMIRSEHRTAFWSKLVARLMTYGGLGFLVFSVIGIKAQHSESSLGDLSVTNLSLVGSMIFTGLSQVVHVKLNYLKQERVSRRYEQLRAQATRRALKSTVTAITLQRNRVTALWTKYAARPAPELITLLAMATEELRAHDAAMKEARRESVGAVERAMERFSQLRKRVAVRGWRLTRYNAQPLREENRT